MIKKTKTNVLKSEHVFVAATGATIASIAGASYLRNRRISHNMRDLHNNMRNFQNFLINATNRLRNLNLEMDGEEEIPRIIIEGQRRINNVNSYFNREIRHRNDRQNSHDTSVNAAKKEIISRLRIEQANVKLVDFKEIIKEINDNDDFTSGQLKEKQKLLKLEAKTVAEYINSKCAYSISADATDYETLRRVWTRANDSLNSENAQKIRQAVFDALVDSWEERFRIVEQQRGLEIQCVDGRVSRLLGALVLLDHDQRNWNFNKLQTYKNELFTLAK